MKKEQTPQQREPKDIRLDVPAEANREKHINFLEAEENNKHSEKDDIDDFVEKRKSSGSRV